MRGTDAATPHMDESGRDSMYTCLMAHYLLIYFHPELGEQRFELHNHRTYRIGSKRGNDIVIPQPDVSRAHAILDVTDGSFHITDLKSKNGTRINGQLVASAEAHCGDEIMLSSARLMIVEMSSDSFGLAPEIQPTDDVDIPESSVDTGRYQAVTDIDDIVALLEMTAHCAESRSISTLLRWVVERFRFDGGMILFKGSSGQLSLIASAGDLDLDPSDRTTVKKLSKLGRDLCADRKIVIEDSDRFGSRFLASALDDHNVLVIRYGETPPAASDLSAIIASFKVALNAVAEPRRGGQRSGPPVQERAEARLDEILGSSPSLKKCKSLAERYARQEEPVLITGESGTGKELFARAIHKLSDRGGGPFVAVNCAAIPSELIEAELFGVAKGAATGVGQRKGKFQAANHGVLFLDEIGDLPLALQGKLLRVLELGEYYRVGDDAPTRCDVRIVSATNRALDAEVHAGRFRADLYYRLHVLRIHIPPLRQRRQDIPALVNAFLEETAAKMHKPVRGLTVRALEALSAYDWPGNVRELRSEIIRAISSVTPGAIIDHTHLSVTAGGGFADGTPALDLAMFRGMPLLEARDAFERILIQASLEEHGGNRTRVAEELGVSRAGLFKKMKRLGITSQ